MFSVKLKYITAPKFKERPKPLAQVGIPVLLLPVLAQLWYTCDVLATLADTVNQVIHVIYMVLPAVVLLEQAKIGIRLELGVSRQHEVKLYSFVLSCNHSPGHAGTTTWWCSCSDPHSCPLEVLHVSLPVRAVEEGMQLADHHHSNLFCFIIKKKDLTGEWLTTHTKHLDLVGCPEVKGASLL